MPPPSVAGLARLERACFYRFTFGHNYQAPVALPVGPWTGSLRQLYTDFETLLLSAELLGAASRLQEVYVLSGLRDPPDATSDQFFE